MLYMLLTDDTGTVRSATDFYIDETAPNGISVEHYSYTSYGERTIYDANLNALPEYSSGIMGTQLGWQARPSLPGSFRRFMDFRNRLFMPAIGMWVTPDPADVHDGPSVCSWGGGHQDPINTTDPMGLALFATDEQSASKLANQLQAYADQGRQPGEARVKIGYRKTGDRYRIVSDSRYAATSQAIRGAGGNSIFRQFASALSDDQSKLTVERDGFGWSIADYYVERINAEADPINGLERNRLLDAYVQSDGIFNSELGGLLGYYVTDAGTFGYHGRQDQLAEMFDRGYIDANQYDSANSMNLKMSVATGIASIASFGYAGMAGATLRMLTYGGAGFATGIMYQASSDATMMTAGVQSEFSSAKTYAKAGGIGFVMGAGTAGIGRAVQGIRSYLARPPVVGQYGKLTLRMHPKATPPGVTPGKWGGLSIKAPRGTARSLSNPGGRGSKLLAEYRRYKAQGFTRAQARYLTQPNEGMGHHFIPRRSWLPRRIVESRFNIMGRGMSRGRCYERHYIGDLNFHGTRFPRSVGGGIWRGSQIGLTKAPRPLNLWYASPDWLRYGAVGAGAAGGGAILYGTFSDSEE